MATTPSSSSTLSLWWKRNRQSILPPLLGTLGFLLFWQLSSSLGLTKLTGPLSLWTDERTRELLLYPISFAACLQRSSRVTRSLSALASATVSSVPG